MRRVSIIEAMVIDMNEAQVRTLEQVRQVLAGTQALQFSACADEQDRYEWIEHVLRRFGYRQLGRAERGSVLAYVQRLSGYSRAQVTRLVSRWVGGKPLVKQYRRAEHAFARKPGWSVSSWRSKSDVTRPRMPPPSQAMIRYFRLGSVAAETARGARAVPAAVAAMADEPRRKRRRESEVDMIAPSWQRRELDATRWAADVARIRP